MPTDLFGGTATSPGTLMLFAQNLMEKGVVSATQESSVGPATRLYDRDRGPQWKSVANDTIDIQVDLELFPRAFSHVGLVNIGINTGIEIYSGANPTGTLRFQAATIMGNDPYIASLGGLFNDRYLRLRILGGGVVPALGELFVGVPRVIRGPFIKRSPRASLYNVQSDESPAGVEWSAVLGPKRTRLRCAWPKILRAELDELEAALDEADQGAKSLIVRDAMGVARWMKCRSRELEAVPLGGNAYEVDGVEFVEQP